MKMGNMREISVEECRRVSGGDIVVTGRKTIPGNTNSSAIYGHMYGSSILPSGIMGLYEDIYDPDGDDDGDTIRNQDEDIVVNGDRTLPTGFKEVPGGVYMYELKVDGTRGPLQFTPWYADLTCEIYDSHQKAISKTSSTYGYLATAIGVLGNGAASTAATLMAFWAEGTGVNSRPAYCNEP
jgi:hypothetical protein